MNIARWVLCVSLAIVAFHAEAAHTSRFDEIKALFERAVPASLADLPSESGYFAGSSVGNDRPDALEDAVVYFWKEPRPDSFGERKFAFGIANPSSDPLTVLSAVVGCSIFRAYHPLEVGGRELTQVGKGDPRLVVKKNDGSLRGMYPISNLHIRKLNVPPYSLVIRMIAFSPEIKLPGATVQSLPIATTYGVFKADFQKLGPIRELSAEAKQLCPTHLAEPWTLAQLTAAYPVEFPTIQASRNYCTACWYNPYGARRLRGFLYSNPVVTKRIGSAGWEVPMFRGPYSLLRTCNERRSVDPMCDIH